VTAHLTSDGAPAVGRIRGAAAAAFALAALAAAAACSTWSGFAAPHPGQFRERPDIPLGEVTLKLHLARPSGGDAPRMLLFHVTGDSGWHGLDPLYFDTMASRGYTLAGVSARALRARLGSLGSGATAARLAADYLALIAIAEARLRLEPGTAVVLTGLSRGAGLAVVAASQPELSRRIAGVLVMGLTADEDNVRPPAAPFALLDRIGAPIVLLQSTVDHYVPAGEARRLFGPDAATRKLVAIDAEGHTFGGHRDELFRQVEAGLDWIARQRRQDGAPPADPCTASAGRLEGP
jgi:dienelactone hydrolase